MARLRSFRTAAVIICAILVVGAGAGAIYLHLRTLSVQANKTMVVPATQTGCPKAGTARAAITAPLVLGPHQNVVYIVNEQQGTTETNSTLYGTLQRYDIVTGKKTVIVKTQYMAFLNAQISADGQWIIFVAERLTNKGLLDEIRMVRMDGQGLQTLYCVDSPPHVGAIYPPLALSPDLKLLAFTIYDRTSSDWLWRAYLLDLTSGKLQPEMIPQPETTPQVTPTYIPSKWLDNTRLYMISLSPTLQSLPIMYLLDTRNGPNQRIDNLQPVSDVPNTHSCWDYDLSSDHTTLFTSQCRGTWNAPGIPSTITVQTATLGLPNTIFSSSTLAVTSIRVANSSTLLFNVENAVGDTNQIGLWKIDTNGSNFTHLISDPVGESDIESGDPWVSVSRNGHMYALDISNGLSQSHRLVFGSLSGGMPTTIFSFIYRFYPPPAIAGWTTM